MKQSIESQKFANNYRPRPAWRVALLVSVSAVCFMLTSGAGSAQEPDNFLRQSIDGDAERGADGGEGEYRFDDDGFESTNRPEGEPVFDPIDDFDADDEEQSILEADSAARNPNSVAADRSNTNRRSTREIRQGPVSNTGADGQSSPRDNLAASPVESGTPVSDENPYAARGIRLGTFDLFPTLEQSIGYTNNADFSQNGTGSGFSETNAQLRLQSLWALHSLQVELGSTYQKFFNGSSDDLPTVEADATLRLDVRPEYTLTLRGGYRFSTESASSTNLNPGAGLTIADRPGVDNLTASAEFAKTQGKLRFSLRGSVDANAYADASLSDGSSLFQADRNNVLVLGTGRLSYQVSSLVSPFIEGSIGRRIYDIKIDSNGNQRDSNLYSLRGGLELNFGEKLNGQLAAGYTVEEFADPNIRTLSTVTLDGTLNWSPVRLTNVTATASTTLSPSANINDNGSVIYSGSLGITRQVRPQLTLDANLTASLRNFDTTGRRDITLGANAGYTYWFNRFVAATGRVSYQNVESTDAGSSYDVGTIRFGLRIQR